MKAQGMVYLVGAGPGDEGLLTRRGAEVLGRADVVVYDALVQPGLLALAPASAERIFGGKRAASHAIPQDELNRLLIEKAQAGRIVVRLKGGDPYVLGRGGEEAAELAGAGIPFGSGARGFIDHRGAELRGNPSHPSRPLLRVHRDHGA